MSFPYAFNHGQLQKMVNQPDVSTVVFSLVNLFNPTMQKEVIHIAAHFADEDGMPLESGKDFEIACPYPPGWNTGHDPSHPDNIEGYKVNFSELAKCPKFIIEKEKLLPAFANFVIKDKIKQLLCALESPNAGNENEPMETQIRFIPDVKVMETTHAGPVANSFSPSLAAKL